MSSQYRTTHVFSNPDLADRFVRWIEASQNNSSMGKPKLISRSNISSGWLVEYSAQSDFPRGVVFGLESEVVPPEDVALKWAKRDLKAALATAPHPLDTGIAIYIPGPDGQNKIIAVMESDNVPLFLANYKPPKGYSLLLYNSKTNNYTK